MSRLLTAQRALTSPRWTQHRLWRLAKAVPSLDLRFADSKSLVDTVTGQSLVTFTRASNATYVDSTGTLQTASTNEPRFHHNPTTGESLGLLVEEQKTNLLLNSATLSTQNVTVTAAAHTLSFSGTGAVTLSGTSTAGPLVGAGTGEANRVSLTFTPTAGTLTLTVSGTVSNAQLELGSSRTSYIPTTTAAATRSADVASITGTAFSSWYRQDEGTVFAETQKITTSLGFIFSLDNGTTSERINGSYNNPSSVQWRNVTGGVEQYSVNSTNNPLAGALLRFAHSYMVNSFGGAANGALVMSVATGSVPMVNSLVIGANINFLGQFNGTIRRLTYFPKRLSNTVLQALTQ